MEKLVDVIKEGEILRVTESQAKAEDLFILRRVEIEQRDSSQNTSKIPQDQSYKKPSILDSWKRGETGYKKNDVISDLVPNFNWDISSKRRQKNLSRRQLAEKAGVTEEEIKNVELGILTRDDFSLISKIENVLGISLRKNNVAPVNLAQLQKSKEEKEKAPQKEEKSDSKKSVLGNDIEIIE